MTIIITLDSQQCPVILESMLISVC